MTLKKFEKTLSPLLWIVAFQFVSAGLGLVTRANIAGWYAGLAKSSLTPPDLAFPIMWSALYVLIALAGWKIFSLRGQVRAKAPLILFALYVVFNWSWSLVFFGAHMVFAGFVWIMAVNILNIAFIARVWPVSRVAGALMVPPLLWTIFAAFLNYQIWALN